MIIAITDERGGMEKSILAGRLAASRALAGRKVLLLDADPRQGAMAQARNLHDGAMHGSLTRPRRQTTASGAFPREARRRRALQAIRQGLGLAQET